MAEFFTDVINIVAEHYPFLLRGVGYTMLIAMVGTLAGLLIGLAAGVLRTCPLSAKWPHSAILPMACVSRRVL